MNIHIFNFSAESIEEIGRFVSHFQHGQKNTFKSIWKKAKILI